MRQKFTPALAFHWLTPLYDRVNDLLGYGRPFMRRVVEMSDIDGGEKILDVSCGTGSLLFEIKGSYPNVVTTGLDPDRDTLRIAQSKLRQVGADDRLVQGVAQELPFPSASFDLITSTMAFHHLPTVVKRKAIREIHRVLKDGGRFVLVDFGKPQTMISKILLSISSVFDGRENMEANLQGRLPTFLLEAGFLISESDQRYRSVQFLMSSKQHDWYLLEMTSAN